MKDEPSTSFEDFNMLMEKLGLGPCDEYDGDNGRGQEEVGVTSRGQGRDSQRTAQEQVGGAWREKDSNKLKEELKNKDSEEKPLSFSGESWREEKSKQVTPEIGELLNKFINFKTLNDEIIILMCVHQMCFYGNSSFGGVVCFDRC